MLKFHRLLTQEFDFVAKVLMILLHFVAKVIICLMYMYFNTCCYLIGRFVLVSIGRKLSACAIRVLYKQYNIYKI